MACLILPSGLSSRQSYGNADRRYHTSILREQQSALPIGISSKEEPFELFTGLTFHSGSFFRLPPRPEAAKRAECITGPARYFHLYRHLHIR